MPGSKRLGFLFDPVSATPAVIQNRMPQGYPWGMPENFAPEGFNLGPQDAPVVQNVVTPAPLVVHAAPTAPPSMNLVPFVNEDMCRPFPPPSEDLGLYDRMDDFQEQFDRMQREMKALRGKELFGQNVNELCLVPNVKVPAKFKVPELRSTRETLSLVLIW